MKIYFIFNILLLKQTNEKLLYTLYRYFLYLQFSTKTTKNNNKRKKRPDTIHIFSYLFVLNLLNILYKIHITYPALLQIFLSGEITFYYYLNNRFYLHLYTKIKDGQTISIFSLPHRYFFKSGSSDHLEDILVNASVQVLPAVTPKIPELIPYPNTSDQFLIVGSFSDTSGIAEGSIIPTVGPVRILRIQIEEEVDHWVALSEVSICDFFSFS